MTSSTSISERDPGRRSGTDAASDRLWRRWIVTFCGTFFGVAGLLYGLVLLIDPYDSDRFPNFGIVGVDDHNPRTAHVSRGRDPQFNSAVFGNSSGQLLDPRRLSAAAGFSFTQLTVPGSGPREQLSIMHWFVARHQHGGALILVTDPTWCSPDANQPLYFPFPFWLYGSNAEYLANVFNSKSLDRAAWRLQLAFGLRQRTDPVGYSDYIAGHERMFGEVHRAPVELTLSESQAGFPWISRLQRHLEGLRPDIAVVLVMPPVYYTLLSPPGSLAAARLTRCKDALAQVVAARPDSGFIDFRTDTPDAHDGQNFADEGHYGKKLERAIEDRIISLVQHSRFARH